MSNLCGFLPNGLLITRKGDPAMAMPSRQIAVGTHPVRLDQGIVGQNISLTPRDDVYMGDTEILDPNNLNSCRLLSAGTTVSVNEVDHSTANRGVWVRTLTGNTYVDITEYGVDPVVEE